MSSPKNLVLFGDQTVEKLSSIRALVHHSKTSPAARRLLQDATDLNHEIHTLLGIALENSDESGPNGVIATVLMCIGRLGELFVYAEEDPSILGSQHDPVHVLAFCTGLLPARALVAARDTSELFEIGREIINITLRMAHQIDRRAKLIEDTNQSGAVTVVGKTPNAVQAILNELHGAQGIPHPKRIANGVSSNSWLTLMDTNGRVHTQYIPAFDIGKVLGHSPLLDIPIMPKARIVSPASCKHYDHPTLGALLSEILLVIAHNILRIHDTAQAIISGMEANRLISLIVASPTGHLLAVQKVLQDKAFKYEIRQHRAHGTSFTRRGGSDLIAIVGISGRFPGSETVETFFEDLEQGKTQHKIPNTRFDLDKYHDPTGERIHTTTAQHGAFMDNPGLFDNRLFNISPRKARQMDPLQRLLLTTSYEALESAGYSKDATLATQSNRIVTYFGQASEDWREILNNEGIDIYYVPSLSRPFGPSRLSYHHRWGGGTYAIDAACATSMTAIQLACSALDARECDTALAGGGLLVVSPNSFVGLSKSGIGIVVLKLYEDALAENDDILGVIRGSARTYTSTSTSIAHPSAESQARIYEVLRPSSVVPNEIAYVEMHGTGTQAGDYEEMKSVGKVLGKGRAKNNMLTVGAVKASVGHGGAAAGVTSLIKVLMMMRERRIPSQPGVPFKLNHHFPKLENVHVRIAGVAGKEWSLKPSPTSDNGKIKCLVNSFDASGGNTSLVVEEPPVPARKNENPLTHHVVTITGRTLASLQQNRQRLLEYLTHNPNVKLADVAYTTTARRMHEVLRIAYIAKSTRELINLLRKAVANKSNDPRTKPAALSTVFTFTGQGSQYIRMGKGLYEYSWAFRELIETYHQMAQYQGFLSFMDLIAGDTADITTASAICVQLTIVTIEFAIVQMLKTWGVQPTLVMGHSLGEYAALCTAGVLSVSDTLFLVSHRARLIEARLTAGEYAMLAIDKDISAAQDLVSLDPKLSVACINAPQATVVSGPIADIKALRSNLEKQGSRATLLKVPYGFHSRHVDPILDDFETIAQAVAFSAPAIPVSSTLLGRVIKAGERGIFSASYRRQAREHVNCAGALQAYQSSSIAKSNTAWVEVGPDPVCVGLVHRSLDAPANRLIPILKSSKENWLTVSSARLRHSSGLVLILTGRSFTRNSFGLFASPSDICFRPKRLRR
ncbi:hypothetical protein CC80DRAFT_595084 [Byssothecium circinans]|uniref:Ketosynthase family 3 (KS3) domain-containing protein n=1 Tax=Byssothecium circinans TaxID=147558 RepID=A0A6A5TRD9_9PLEO|nr:hypothetical protein CC80DRAFT_595084 [Byssothecium circinans]